MASLKDQVAAVKTASDGLQSALRPLVDSLIAEVGRSDQLAKEIEDKKTEFAAWGSKIEAARAEHSTIRAAVAKAQQDKAVAEQQLADAKTALAALKAKL